MTIVACVQSPRICAQSSAPEHDAPFPETGCGKLLRVVSSRRTTRLHSDDTNTRVVHDIGMVI